ncbi:MAG TPA: BlaI/MecI/CopY family transcriptional regulator [Propionibacteriaceae bacterium]|nr:BlaI/MecI/CopY family transcriptional regulator [Propionibacteriaceae bacterium]
MAILGDLEHLIMAVLWQSSEPQSVREVHEKLRADRDLAYTTVMTVLDRLAKKELVSRELDGRAWRYRPAVSAAQLVSEEMHGLLGSIPEASSDALVHFAGLLDDSQRELLARAVADAGVPASAQG